jgi:hypothetical protein
MDRYSTASCPPPELPFRLTRAKDSARNHREIYRLRVLRFRRTVPRLATGSPRFSYPQTLLGGATACRGLPVAMLASANLPEASVRLPPKDGAARATARKSKPAIATGFSENRGLAFRLSARSLSD